MAEPFPVGTTHHVVQPRAEGVGDVHWRGFATKRRCPLIRFSGRKGGVQVRAAERKEAMAESAFFSFHYDRDAWRVQQVINMGKLEGQPLLSAQKWEEVKRRGDQAIKAGSRSR